MTRTVVDAVAKDHERLHEMVRRLGSVRRGRDSLLNRLRSLYVGHARALEAVLCPVAGVDAERAGLLSLDTRLERTLDALAVARDLDHEAMADLERTLDEHCALSTRVLLAVQAAIGPSRLEVLTAEYEHRRSVEASALRPMRSTPRRLDRARTDLYEEARRTGISGRSSMTREQLIDALRATDGSPTPSRAETSPQGGRR
jgi:hypothetical protein